MCKRLSYKKNDTLLLAKDDYTNYINIFGKFNSFHKNLKFTMNCFDDNNLHFWDIAIDNINTDLCYNPTCTEQCSSFNSSLPWNYETSWIKSLHHRAKKICPSKEKFKYQTDKIKLFMSRNGYASYTHNSIIKQFRNNTKRNRNEETNDKKKIFWIRLTNLG